MSEVVPIPTLINVEIPAPPCSKVHPAVAIATMMPPLKLFATTFVAVISPAEASKLIPVPTLRSS